MSTSNKQQSILLIGATGRSGNEILKQLLANNTKPKVHAFIRDPSKLEPEYKDKCASIFKGDARSPSDIERALTESNADLVIVAVGNGDDTGKSDIRTTNAQAVATAMEQPGMESVNAIVLSSFGAGPTQVKVGFGIGKLIEYQLRHVFKDHDGQESAFLDNGLADRVMIVRPTSLTDGKANGKIIEFGDSEKAPSINIDRGDVGVFVAKEACSIPFAGGKTVNITGGK